MGIFLRVDYCVKMSQVPAVIFCIRQNAEFRCTEHNTVGVGIFVFPLSLSNLDASWAFFWPIDDVIRFIMRQYNENKSLSNKAKRFTSSMSHLCHVSVGF